MRKAIFPLSIAPDINGAENSMAAVTLREEEFSLKELLVQVNTIISGQCNDKGLTYEFHIIGSIAHSYLGDDLKLRQVMINILGNAVKFTPAPGKVVFSVQQKECVDDKCTLEFIMSDTGVGMSEEFMPKLFDAFTQEDSTAQSKYGSTGLGMSIARNIVQMMNGDITVTSKKGEGSTFTVVVTLKDAKKGTLTEEDVMRAEAPEPVMREKTAGNNNLAGIRVLIVEDMMVNAQMLGAILDTREVLHEWAENGQLGLERFSQSEPNYYDVIIMDLQMPVMDGLTAAREIRALDRDDAKVTPIIAVSANAFSEDVQSSLEAGMNAHISKPIEIPVLFETLARFVGTKD